MEPISPNPFSGTSSSVVPVGKGTRFAEAFIDGIIYGIVTNVITYALVAAGIAASGLSLLISLGVQFAYYYFQEKGSGLTIGKRVMGTKAVMIDGSPVTDEAVLKRSLWRLIPIVDAVTFLISERGLHDTQSNTAVVSTKTAPMM